jgi:hypothetical protein
MKFLRTPAPFPSTVISLAPEEMFRYRTTRIQSVTVDPAASAPYTLSGITPGTRRHRTYTLPELPLAASELLRSQAASELQRFATPVPEKTLHPDAEAVLSRPRTTQVPEQPQHLAAATPPPVPAPLRAGKHRA